MKIHTVEIAFNCSKCDDNLPNRTVYNRHMKSHSKSKPVAPDQDYTDKNIHEKNAHWCETDTKIAILESLVESLNG